MICFWCVCVCDPVQICVWVSEIESFVIAHSFVHIFILFLYVFTHHHNHHRRRRRHRRCRHQHHPYDDFLWNFDAMRILAFQVGHPFIEFTFGHVQVTMTPYFSCFRIIYIFWICVFVLPQNQPEKKKNKWEKRIPTDKELTRTHCT